MIRIASGLLIVAAIAVLFVLAMMVALLELVLPLLGRVHDWCARAIVSIDGRFFSRNS